MLGTALYTLPRGTIYRRPLVSTHEIKEVAGTARSHFHHAVREPDPHVDDDSGRHYLWRTTRAFSLYSVRLHDRCIYDSRVVP